MGIQEIQDRWKNEECLLFDGVVFADGRLIEFSEDKTNFRLSKSSETTIESFLLKDKDPWVQITRSARISIPGGVVWCGEGSMGGDGFVALADDRENLKWIAFFQFSNPFISISFAGDTITALNNLGQKWLIPENNPESLKIFSES